MVVVAFAKQRVEEARGVEASLVDERGAGVEEGLPVMRSEESLASEENLRWYLHLRSHDSRPQWERSIGVLVTREVLDLDITAPIFSTSEKRAGVVPRTQNPCQFLGDFDSTPTHGRAPLSPLLVPKLTTLLLRFS